MTEDQNGDQVANARHVARAHHNVVDRNPLIVLFESMLPWIDYGSSDGVGEHDDQYNKLLKNSALLVIETLVHGGSDARDWACVRKEAFSSEKNE
ncbi:hypothetical protein U1Q18_015078 [Sarracenia purpurea var. burkii]